MIIPEIWRPKHAFKFIGTMRKDSDYPTEMERHHEILEELNMSLLAVMQQTATNRDYAKLIRHGYEDMHLRLNMSGEVTGVRYTMRGKKYIATIYDGGTRPLYKSIFREPLLEL